MTFHEDDYFKTMKLASINDTPKSKDGGIKKGINAFMSFTLCFTTVAVIPSIFIQMDFGFKTGGPTVMLYGWLVVGLFSILVGCSLAEICSTYPVAGSVYYWSGALAPREYRGMASYATGWLNLFGNLAVC